MICGIGKPNNGYNGTTLMDDSWDQSGSRSGRNALFSRRNDAGQLQLTSRPCEERRQGAERRGAGIKSATYPSDDREKKLVAVRPYAFRSFDDRRSHEDRRYRHGRRQEDQRLNDWREMAESWREHVDIDCCQAVLTPAEVRALLEPPDDD